MFSPDMRGSLKWESVFLPGRNKCHLRGALAVRKRVAGQHYGRKRSGVKRLLQETGFNYADSHLNPEKKNPPFAADGFSLDSLQKIY
jgi:hypothetical protein